MQSAFTLMATLGLDSSGFDKGLDDAKGKGLNLGEKLKSGFKVAGAAVAAVGAATAAATTALVKNTGELAAYGDNIDKMSQKLGISAEAYQEWDAILQHSGTSIDGMQRGMMSLAAAAEKGADGFQKLGISQEEVASLSQEDLFARVVSGLQDMEEGSERAVLAQQLLGGAAKELGPLLNTSAEDTEAMRQKVHELGGVMSDEAVKAAASYQDALQDMQTAFKGLSRGLTADFMPGITTVMDGLTAIFSGDSEGGIQMVSDGIDKVLSDITDRLPQFLELGGSILESLVDALIQNLPKLLEMGARLLGQLVAGLIKEIPTLIKSVPAIIKAIVDGLVAGWPSIREAGVDLIKTLGEGVRSMIDSALGWGREVIQNFINGILSGWNKLKGALGAFGEKVAGVLGFSSGSVSVEERFVKGNGRGTTVNFTQNNYSPKALSRTEIYRNTQNGFAVLGGAT